MKNEEKYINEQVLKGLHESNQNKNVMIVKYLNESLIDLRNNINIKHFLKMKTLKNPSQHCRKNPRL